MRVMIIPAQKLPMVKDIEGHLYDLQYYVDGFIEPCAPVQLRQQGIEILCNEEGLLRQLPVNINLFPFFFVGTLVAVGVDDDEFTSLTAEQVDYLKKWLSDLP